MQEPHWNVFNYLALTWNQRINSFKKAICKVFFNRFDGLDFDSLKNHTVIQQRPRKQKFQNWKPTFTFGVINTHKTRWVTDTLKGHYSERFAKPRAHNIRIWWTLMDFQTQVVNEE